MGQKKMLKTQLCERLGIEYPIFLAGMGWTSGPTLTAAVSNAGGLGVLGGSNLNPDEAREWIRKTKSLTDKPFGLNLILPPDVASTDAPVDFKDLIPPEHFEFVDKIMDELELPKTEFKVPWEDYTFETMKEIGRICIEERLALFVSGLGDPSWIISDAHDCGMLVSSCVGNTKNAKRLSDSGVDIIIAQGYEGGGHTGRVGTMALVPQVIDAVQPKSVLAAGGLADGRGLAASLALGAEGVWMGTAFVATHEANADLKNMNKHFYFEPWVDNWKKTIIEAIDESTVISKITSGKTARHIRNKMIDLWEKEKFTYLPLPLQGYLVWDLYSNLAQSYKYEYMLPLAGQGAGLIKEVKSAENVVKDIIEQALEILTKDLPERVIVK
ncbi:MAG: nitronate monooxygenase [Desulfobacterales bacterium]|nr:nitronate monooxygenase [Desulfobacteraceae bacterium]MBT7696835.1 nitronate monooxygenase [Desulfobacterales bacterium]